MPDLPQKEDINPLQQKLYICLVLKQALLNLNYDAYP
jgi:hypothetical protein